MYRRISPRNPSSGAAFELYVFLTEWIKLQLAWSSVSNIIVTFFLLWTCSLFMLFFWFSIKVLHSLFEIPFSKHSDRNHIETILPTYIANQLPSLHMTQPLSRGISKQTLLPNKHCAKYIHMIFKFLSIIYQ